ncbi:MAG: hypothetical protein OQJ84_03885 [Xanthomonadales bacterium]|nr:hypothetical protein [Xanthomonadales bacterium]
MMATVSIPSRFNGPPLSGNGGYSCGLLAAFIDGPARVRLHVPPPLDRELRVVEAQTGRVEMYDGDTLVGSGVSARETIAPPVAPSQAKAADAANRYIGRHGHPLGTCFVCGPDRPARDGLELFTGPVEDWSLLACTWQPADDLLDDAGNVRPEFVWAALDCPGYFAAIGSDLRLALLGELYAELHAPVPGGEPLVVFSWPIGEDGRKLYAGAAVATRDGNILACSRSTWILPKDKVVD